MTESKAYCPNCGDGAVRDDNIVICEKCGSFKITKSGEARPTKINPISDLKERVSKLESLVREDEPPAEPQEDKPDEEVVNNNQDDDNEDMW